MNQKVLNLFQNNIQLQKLTQTKQATMNAILKLSHSEISKQRPQCKLSREQFCSLTSACGNDYNSGLCTASLLGKPPGLLKICIFIYLLIFLSA